MAWNRSDGKTTATAQRSQPKRMHGLIAGSLVVAIGAGLLAYIYLGGEEQACEERQKKTPALVKEVKPSVSHKTVTDPVQTNAVRRKKSNVGAKTYIDERGVKRYEGGARVFDGLPRRKPVRVAKPSIFKHYAENQLSTLIETEPGETVFVTRKYDKRFMDSLRECLKDKIEILETDSELDRERKEAMIEVKEKIAKMDENEARQMIEETYSELQRLAQYKRDVEKMARDAMKEKEGLTDQDCDDIISAANLMLKDKGIAPIRKSALIKQNLKFHFKKEKKQ